MTQSWGQKEWRCSNKELLELGAGAVVRAGKRVGGGKDQQRGERGCGTALPRATALLGFNKDQTGFLSKYAKTLDSLSRTFPVSKGRDLSFQRCFNYTF